MFELLVSVGGACLVVWLFCELCGLLAVCGSVLGFWGL